MKEEQKDDNTNTIGSNTKLENMESEAGKETQPNNDESTQENVSNDSGKKNENQENQENMESRIEIETQQNTDSNTGKPSNESKEILKKIKDNLKSINPDVPQTMRRCFMNGKQCMFCSQLEPSDDENQEEIIHKRQDEVFVVMPFRSNLDTFYEWSLKPYLRNSGIDEDKIHRADKFRNIGYIMCERICRRIQEASLIVVDISLKNANVFYELGISVGLNKPILFICDKEKFESRDRDFWTSFGLDPNSVVQYPSVGELNEKENKIKDKATKQKLCHRERLPKISAIIVSEEDKHLEAEGDKHLETEGDKHLETEGDISAKFGDTITTAVRVAIEQIIKNSDKNSLSLEQEKIIRLHLDEVIRNMKEIKEALDKNKHLSCKDPIDKTIVLINEISNFNPNIKTITANLEKIKEDILDKKPLNIANVQKYINILEKNCKSLGKKTDLTEAIEKLRKSNVKENDNDLERMKKCDIYILHEKRQGISYSKLEEKVASSFACIIDLKDEDYLSYYWLGYCHARGINAIPIHRISEQKNTQKPIGYYKSEKGELIPVFKPFYKPSEQEDNEEQNEMKTVLAFDIRALWYMRHTQKEQKSLSDGFSAVLEELIIKDILTQQRDIFWERLSRKENKLHIYTGAVHHPELQREVVGDWDLRTVSELVRYLSSASEPIIPELEHPIYAPETIALKLIDEEIEKISREYVEKGRKKDNESKVEQLKDYINKIKEYLEKFNTNKEPTKDKVGTKSEEDKENKEIEDYIDKIQQDIGNSNINNSEALSDQIEKTSSDIKTFIKNTIQIYVQGIKESYINLIKGELAEKNCLIVASADSNPLTEVILGEAYSVKIKNLFTKSEQPQYNERMIIALKGTEPKKGTPLPYGNRYFAIPTYDGLEAKHRGFLVDDKIVQYPYLSQDEVSSGKQTKEPDVSGHPLSQDEVSYRQQTKEFDVLGHLVIMENPYRNKDSKLSNNEQKTKKIIVILSGVSGPGTFGLAEVLTGGDKDKYNKDLDSEKILFKINKCWDDNVGENYVTGVEALVKVHIIQSEDEGKEANEETKVVHRKFYDKRKVENWELWFDNRYKIPDIPKKPAIIKEVNPRFFPDYSKED